MSGGHFYNHSPHEVGDAYTGEWDDAELNELSYDLFGGGWDGYHGSMGVGKRRKPEFGRTWASDYTGGLAETLDLYKSGDIGEEDYREQVNRFKVKWLARRTPRNRVDFYVSEFEDAATSIMERLKREMKEI